MTAHLQEPALRHLLAAEGGLSTDALAERLEVTVMDLQPVIASLAGRRLIARVSASTRSRDAGAYAVYAVSDRVRALAWLADVRSTGRVGPRWAPWMQTQAASVWDLAQRVGQR